MEPMCASLFNLIKLAGMPHAKIISYNLIAHFHMLEICKTQFYANGIQQLTNVPMLVIQLI